MKTEIKEILDYFRHIVNDKKETYTVVSKDTIYLEQLLDYITNLQEENKRLKEVAHKMHLWIFLHSDNEQKVYDEIGLTEKENAMLGYSGQFRLQGKDTNVKDKKYERNV